MKTQKMIQKVLVLSTLLLAAPSFATTPTAPAAPAAAAAPGAKSLTVQSGNVEFLAIGTPSFIKVKGEGAKPTGNLSIANGKASGEFKLDLTQFKTGMEKRDTHMKETLEVEKYPTATITFKDVAVPNGKATIPAELELHGQKKPVSLEAEFTEGKANGKMRVKLSEFGIKPPSFAGVTVKDDVDVTINSVIQ